MLLLTDLFPIPATCELKHPGTGEKLGVSMTLVGPDSTEATTAQKSLVKKLQAKMNDEEASPDELAEVGAQFLQELVTGWSSDEFFGSAFSKEAAGKLLRDPQLKWLRQQVDDFCADRKNFFRPSV